MFCRSCGAELPEKTSPCPSCGNVTSSPLLSTPAMKRNCCTFGCIGTLALFLITAILGVYFCVSIIRKHHSSPVKMQQLTKAAPQQTDKGLSIAIQRWLFDHKQVKLKTTVLTRSDAEGDYQFVIALYKQKELPLLFQSKGVEVVAIYEMGSKGRTLFWKKGMKSLP